MAGQRRGLCPGAIFIFENEELNLRATTSCTSYPPAFLRNVFQMRRMKDWSASTLLTSGFYCQISFKYNFISVISKCTSMSFLLKIHHIHKGIKQRANKHCHWALIIITVGDPSPWLPITFAALVKACADWITDSRYLKEWATFGFSAEEEEHPSLQSSYWECCQSQQLGVCWTWQSFLEHNHHTVFLSAVCRQFKVNWS